MENKDKVCVAIHKIKPNTEFAFLGDIVTEKDFNKIKWVVGVDSENASITTTTNPHSEITWSLFKAEYDKL